MKLFGFMLFLILAALSATVVADVEMDPEVEKCKEGCVLIPDNSVCGTGTATFRNECEMKCANAELIHPGPCDRNDLMGNRIHLR